MKTHRRGLLRDCEVFAKVCCLLGAPNEWRWLVMARWSVVGVIEPAVANCVGNVFILAQLQDNAPGRGLGALSPAWRIKLCV